MVGSILDLCVGWGGSASFSWVCVNVECHSLGAVSTLDVSILQCVCECVCVVIIEGWRPKAWPKGRAACAFFIVMNKALGKTAPSTANNSKYQNLKICILILKSLFGG